ncbi:glycosyltransferase family 50 protein [Dichomitus squalens LYAD-421 SS1]|uniref:glycosyltransferase family 50 protein n=1 Tax=Dichomitus squalens (strain LYAD-421) TaxID=732165 RepID=UPI0004411B66|nr:glycosyltransferase family 50 protein [Dichomitus squalens LYAD-421 SS1]EJF66079.1 glycosyltransferase family 50 protein [Dichomitus squalens LYAD-421 SS1]
MSLYSDHILRHVPSFSRILVASSILRIALIIYSEWHDAHSIVKYTDVDYRVFSDAARFMLHPSPDNRAEGPLAAYFNFGSPYTRATYRYTPLLAVLLAPNEWVHPSFGKFLFAAADIVAGVLMHNLLLSIVLPDGSRIPQKNVTENASSGAADAKNREEALRRRATFLVSLHLLNPLVFTISTRGSSESVLSLFVLATLYYALKGNWDLSAVLLGLSTHWKIYPFIYGVACLGVIGREHGAGGGLTGYLRSILNRGTARFGLISGMTFLACGVAMYAIWGQPFLEESYLYHLHRLDHRHNFSPYFYLVYLTYPSAQDELSLEASGWKRLLRSPLTSFIPQMVLALGTGLLFGRRKEDLVFTWTVQTFVFVVFNKVCTSQYFLWYTLFLPLLLPRLSMSGRRALAYGAVWIGTQALWLSEAYKLEFLGQNVFFGLWARGLVYVVGNCWVLAGIMDSYTES